MTLRNGSRYSPLGSSFMLTACLTHWPDATMLGSFCVVADHLRCTTVKPRGQDRTRTSSHKCGIALKELKESNVNLRLQLLSGLMPETDGDLVWLTQECGELVKITGKIISNKKRKGGGYGSAS